MAFPSAPLLPIINMCASSSLFCMITHLCNIIAELNVLHMLAHSDLS